MVCVCHVALKAVGKLGSQLLLMGKTERRRGMLARSCGKGTRWRASRSNTSDICLGFFFFWVAYGMHEELVQQQHPCVVCHCS